MTVKRPARAIALGVGVVLVAFAVLLASQVNTDPSYKGGDLLGKPVPVFELPLLDDSAKVRSADLRGKVVLVNFWNSWCIPCHQEHPSLQRFYESHKDDTGFEMIGIVRDDTKTAAREWVREKQDGWTFLDDPDGQASLLFGTTGQPESYMIAANGIVVGMQRAPVTVANLEEMYSVAKQAA